MSNSEVNEQETIHLDRKVHRMIIGGLLLFAGTSLAVGLADAPAASAQPQVTTVAVGAYPWGVAVNYSTGYVYVTNELSDTVSVINEHAQAGPSVVATIPVGVEPEGVAVNTSTDAVYVTNFGGDSLSVINGNPFSANFNTVIATVKFGSSAIDPDSVAVDPSTGMVYVGGYMSSNVLAYSSTDLDVGINAPDANFHITGANIHDVVFDQADDGVFASAYNLGDVAYISTTGGANQVLTGLDGPAGLAVNLSTGALYVAENWANADRVTVYPKGAPSSVVQLTGDPNALSVDSSTGVLFASLPASNSVAEVNQSTGNVSYVPVGSTPEGIDVDPFTGNVFVANSGSGTVSVF
jgi:YVTN family beta-propeller protein